MHGPRGQTLASAAGPPPELNDRSILASAARPEGRSPVHPVTSWPPAAPPSRGPSSLAARPPLSLKVRDTAQCWLGAARLGRLSPRGRRGFGAYQNRRGTPTGAGAGRG